MWDSEFEFEDDDCELEDYEAEERDLASGEGTGQVNDKLKIENAYYEAEDVVLRDPNLAATRFEELLLLLNGKLETGGTPTLPLQALQKWQLKALQHLVKLPVLGVPERWQHFGKLLEVTHQVPWAESSGAITGALDAFEEADSRGLKGASPNLVVEAHEAAARAAEERNIMSGWRQIALRLTHYLIRARRMDEALRWLGALYRDWLRGILAAQGKDDPHVTGDTSLSHPLLWKSIQAAPNEDSHLLEIIALDLERCELQGLKLRATKLVAKCLTSGRAFLQKRTLIGVRRYVAKYHFARGEYRAAYTAFFDAFEAVCSVGDTRLGRELLLSVMVCNVMSGSDIDPRTTREAHSLLNTGQAESLEKFRSQVDHIVALNTAVKKDDLRALVKLLQDPEAFVRTDPMCIEADICGQLLTRVRERCLTEVLLLWTSIELDWLVQELALTDTRECIAFLLHYIRGKRNLLSVAIEEDFIKVQHHDQEQGTAQELMQLCQGLLRGLEPNILRIL